MKKNLALVAMAVLALGLAACDDKTETTTESTDAAGTVTEQTTTTETSSDGSSTESTTTVDPEGLGNKSETTHTEETKTDH